MRTTKTADDFYDTIDHAATIAGPLFNLYGWEYDGVPKHGKLVETITSLVEEVLRQFNKGHDRCYTSTGRFIVTYGEFAGDGQRELTIAIDIASQSEFKSTKEVWE